MTSRKSIGGNITRTQQKEKDPWFVEVQKELDMRNRLCAQRNPSYVYQRPETSPYTYKSVAEFRKRHAFNKLKDCKAAKADNEMDVHNRYYKNITTKKECDASSGHWDTKAINRK